jgi:hypothetical protein
MFTITITEEPGRCRLCGCTYEHACAVGCSWANRQQTLCSACVPLDRALRTIAGRRALAEFVQEAGFEPLPQMGHRR